MGLQVPQPYDIPLAVVLPPPARGPGTLILFEPGALCRTDEGQESVGLPLGLWHQGKSQLARCWEASGRSAFVAEASSSLAGQHKQA